MIKEQFAVMLDLQDQLNEMTVDNWKEAGNDFHRAAWIEAAELMDKIGWKWWKKQEFDKYQAHLELVDIFHFLMSELLKEERGTLATARELVAAMDNCLKPSGDNFVNLNLIERMVLHLIRKETFSAVKVFFSICHGTGLDLNTLFKMYIGKNALNKLRQDRGYKYGKYVKIWDNFGNEDNFYLERILNSLELGDPEDSFEEVYNLLNIEYEAVLALELVI